MNHTKKSRKLLLVATALTIIAMASILTVYAAFLVTFNGNAVNVNDIASGNVMYSTDGGSTFGASPSEFNVGNSLYTRFELISTSYSESATVTWHLQKNNLGSWDNVGSPKSTTVSSLAADQIIYVSDDGEALNNFNWGTLISTGGSYRVTATVTSAS